MNFNRDKKGLSEIVTSILIILIAVAAVVVIWQVLLPLIKGPGEQSVSLADCTANPVTLANPVCPASNIPSVSVTKLGSKAVTAVTITFTNQEDASDNGKDDLGALAGTTIATSDAAIDDTKIAVISGSYTLGTATSPCNIPEVLTIQC